MERLSSLKMDMVTRGQIPDDAVCISHSANILGKEMNLTILLPTLAKLQARLGSLTLVCKDVSVKENFDFKPITTLL